MALFDGLKAAADALRQADKIPQFQAVLDAQAQIAELQVFNHEQKLEIRRLTEELERVRSDQASAEGSKIWEHLLWIVGDDDPFCLYCFEKQKRLFHVNRIRAQKGIHPNTVCPECKNVTERSPSISFWQAKIRNHADHASANLEDPTMPPP